MICLGRRGDNWVTEYVEVSFARSRDTGEVAAIFRVSLAAVFENMELCVSLSLPAGRKLISLLSVNQSSPHRPICVPAKFRFPASVSA